MEKRVLADDYVKAYGFNLSESNPRIKDLEISGKNRTAMDLYLKKAF